MKNKKLIFILIVSALALSIVYIDRYYIYPLSYNLPELSSAYDIYNHSSKINNVLQRLEANRTTDKELVFWETPVRLGMTKSELIEFHPSTSEINYAGKTIEAQIIYDCTYEAGDAQLKTISLRIPYEDSIEKDIVSYYGKKYIRSKSSKGEYEKNFYVWVLEGGYAVLERSSYSTNEDYLYFEIGVLENSWKYSWKKNVVYGAYNSMFEDKDRYLDDIVPQKDSIDILIEQRKFQTLNSTIFADLDFGDSPEIVERRLKDDKYRKIKVPKGEKVATVYVASHDAKYYDNQLASLVLYADENELADALETLYSTKYGKTKNKEWHFQDCSIEINYGTRPIYDPMGDAGYRSSGPTLYHSSYRGERTSSITQDGSFLRIEYKNHRLIGLMNRDRQIKDSLENVRKIKEAAEEKIIANKLATEIATGI